MNPTNKTVVLTSLAVITFNIQAQSHQKQMHPNLVIIISDQFRGQALDDLGLEKTHTPNLDHLASEGVNFTNASSCYPLSSPARAMLMTGMYPFSNHVVGNCNSKDTPYGVELSQDAVCWSDILKQQGYSTGYIGKWHLDAPHKPYVNTSNNKGKVAWNEWCSPNRRHGFEYWMAYGTYDNHLHPMYWATNTPRDSFFYVNEWEPQYDADKAIDYINNKNNVREQGSPFALVISMNPPHTAYSQVPDKYINIYKNDNVETLINQPDIPIKGTKWGNFYRENIIDYYACIAGVDEQIGRIISALKKKHLFHNTIVVFVSDHGDCIGMHGEEAKNNPYEESMRTPLIITYPKEIKPRIDHTLLIGMQDLYPTVLSLMGFEHLIPSTVQTNNLAKAVKGEKQKLPTFMPYYQIAAADSSTGWRGIRTLRYTLAIEFKHGKRIKTLLFDRKKDPFEMNNLDNDNILLEQQTKILKKWLTQQKDPLRNSL